MLQLYRWDAGVCLAYIESFLKNLESVSERILKISLFAEVVIKSFLCNEPLFWSYPCRTESREMYD